MLLEQTKEKLSSMKFRGMLEALNDWCQRGAKQQSLEPLELVGLLVDAEWTDRENRKLTTRLQLAKFSMPATVEDLDFQHSRGLQKQKLLDLLSCRWIQAHENIIITGPTGIGKTYLPSALGNKACREGYRVIYARAPRLFGDLFQARADGSYRRLLQKFAKADVLIIDDLGTSQLEAGQRSDLREILEDRYAMRSTVITSQLDPTDWHSFIGDDTIADAICDRLVHNAHRFKLNGESLRKKYGLNRAKKEAEEK